jgi:hypothetical protein
MEAKGLPSSTRRDGIDRHRATSALSEQLRGGVVDLDLRRPQPPPTPSASFGSVDNCINSEEGGNRPVVDPSRARV